MNSISTCAISSERVNDLDAGFFEIVRIPRGNGQAMNKRSRGDQTVLERHRVTGSAPLLEMVVVMLSKILSYLEHVSTAKHKKPITPNGVAAALNPHVSSTQRTVQN